MRVEPDKELERKAAEKKLKTDKLMQKIATGLAFFILYYLFVKILFL